MRKAKYIALLLTLLTTPALAENIVQFTGGNYIFAETGRLTFNLEPSVFEARNWQYNPATDSAETTFKLNLQLKTRYTSEFHGYEASLNNKFHTVAMQNRASQWQSMQVKPVYQQKAFLPAAGWFIAAGGAIARQVLPPIIANCFRSLNCSAKAIGGLIGAAELCSINIELGKSWLPFGICSKAEADGWVKQPDGTYKKKSQYQVSAGGGEYKSYSTFEQMKADGHNICIAAGKNLSNNYVYKEDYQISENTNIIKCLYSNGSSDYWGWVNASWRKVAIEETMNMIDLQNYAMEDFKQNPNAYVNNSGDLGSGLRGSVKATKADINSASGQGTFSVIGAQVYRDPNTGKTVQDTLTIQSAQSGGSGTPSGNPSQKTPGTSGTYNNVTVNKIDRSDKEAEAQPGKENGKDGIRPGSGSASGVTGGGSSGSGDVKEEDDKGCKEGNDALACAKLGDVQQGDNPFSIPGEEDATTWKPDFFLPSGGACPAPKTLSLRGYSIKISYDPLCQFAERIRFLMIALASVAAGFIVFGRKG